VPIYKVASHRYEAGEITCPTPAICKYASLMDNTACRNTARTIYVLENVRQVNSPKN
jgi:hypothetical protein